MSLFNFLAASLNVQLSSSSSIVGKKEQVLTMTISPVAGGLLPASGMLVMAIPDYYEGARSD